MKKKRLLIQILIYLFLIPTLLLIIGFMIFEEKVPREVETSPWSMEGGNPQRPGLSTYDTKDNPGGLKWKFQKGKQSYTSGVIAGDGTIYTGAHDYDTGENYLYALTYEGKMEWKVNVEGAREIALGEDGTIYVLDYYLYAINPDATIKWKLEPGEHRWRSFMVQSDNIYLTAHDNRLYSLDLNGVERWSVSLVADEHDLRNESPCSLCVDNNGNIYVNVRNMGDDYIISLHSNGSFRWYYKFGVSVESNPTIGPNGRIYVVSYDWIEDDGGILFSLNQQGEVEWTCEIDGWAISFSPVLGPDGTIYIGTVDGILYSISPEGTLKWKYTCGNSIEMPSIGSDGTIYFGLGEVYRDDDDGEGSIVALSSNGKQKWKTQLGKLEPYQPAIGTNGYLYVGTGRGFYALGDQTFDEFLTPGFECTSMIMIVGFIIVSLKKRGKGARSR